eukprot:528989-Karenia_brevis.AAC.1
MFPLKGDMMDCGERVLLPDELEDQPCVFAASSRAAVPLPLPLEAFASEAARIRKVPLPDELDALESDNEVLTPDKLE